MQSHCQQGGEIDLGPGIEVVTALQSTDELHKKKKKKREKNLLNQALSHGRADPK